MSAERSIGLFSLLEHSGQGVFGAVSVPGVAWSTLCLPRKFGGVGLVDIADQSLALHLVYLQRLMRPQSSSDFVTAWLVYASQPDLGILDGVTCRENLSRALKRVDYVIRPGLISSPSLLVQYYRMPYSNVATSRLPDCSQWTISNSSRSSVSVSRLTLGALRRYWHPAREIITSRMGRPLSLPAPLRLRPASWRLFWSLELPAKAFIPWWRLIHDRIGHRSWLNRIVPDKVPSPLCALCGVNEDLSILLSDLLPSSLAVWTALTSFCSPDMVELCDDVLLALDAGSQHSIEISLAKRHRRGALALSVNNLA
ncbi:hypothetical protein [Parasitella parasitica]|uniref:Reverse transcriptase zinc-binding domain-containing protein n=1 Tax=Parasitella parasitica TaxID=35722 RepID=A0A0B7N855_9FUNG|nr:hypothetical protein [Parasitella parasitica]